MLLWVEHISLLCMELLLLFSSMVMSNSWWPHGLQHARLPCSSPPPWSLLKLTSIELVMPSSHLILCRPLLLLPLIFCSVRVFPMSWLLASSGQSIGASASASVLPMNIQGWFPLGLTGLIFLSRELSSVSSGTAVQKHQFFGAQPSLWSNSHVHIWLLEEKGTTEDEMVRWPDWCYGCEFV